MSEDYLMKDGVVLSPINGTDLGLRDRVEMINKDSDLQVFIHTYSTKANQVQRAAAPYQEYLMVLKKKRKMQFGAQTRTHEFQENDLEDFFLTNSLLSFVTFSLHKHNRSSTLAPSLAST